MIGSVTDYSISRCTKDEVPLFHLTQRKYLKQICREGLRPQVTQFVVDVFSDRREVSRDEAKRRLKPMVFAVERDDLDEAVSSYGHLDTALGIKHGRRCAGKFRAREINMPHDRVSVETIPADCLCLVKDADI